MEKLDASDSRLSHLEGIERGLADLLVHVEDMRANKDAGGLRAQGSPEVDGLKQDIARTQDALETVHGMLGHVVDRLATIEKDYSRRRTPGAAAHSRLAMLPLRQRRCPMSPPAAAASPPTPQRMPAGRPGADRI